MMLGFAATRLKDATWISLCPSPISEVDPIRGTTDRWN
jgi:hypothetical protein